MFYLMKLKAIKHSTCNTDLMGLMRTITAEEN